MTDVTLNRRDYAELLDTRRTLARLERELAERRAEIARNGREIRDARATVDRVLGPAPEEVTLEEATK